MSRYAFVLAPIALGLSACATAIPPVEVTRFHIDNPPRAGTIAVSEAPDNPDVGLEFRTYATAVSAELQRVGFTPGADMSSDYIALVGFQRSFRPTGQGNEKPVSVGVGGGLGSGGYSGLGVGIGINLSGKPKDMVTTELRVQIRRRSDSATVWEGRGYTEAREGSPAAQPGVAAAKVAGALIGGYPGESGRTIRVK
jgi:hypothetical protein